jgi:hypothetical protein
MGCSKPPPVRCPQNTCGLSVPNCGPGCSYFFWDTVTGGIIYTASPSKTIDQFTTDELLAEIRRRVK